MSDMFERFTNGEDPVTADLLEKLKQGKDLRLALIRHLQTLSVGSEENLRVQAISLLYLAAHAFIGKPSDKEMLSLAFGIASEKMFEIVYKVKTNGPGNLS
jgi:hypothetical protein